MNFGAKVTLKNNCIQLEGALLFATIMQTRTALFALLDQVQEDTVLDFSAVTQIDSSALSLWLAGQRKAQQLNLTLISQGISQELQTMAELVDLETYL